MPDATNEKPRKWRLVSLKIGEMPRSGKAAVIASIWCHTHARKYAKPTGTGQPASIRSPCVTSERTASRNPGSSPALSAAMISR